MVSVLFFAEGTRIADGAFSRSKREDSTTAVEERPPHPSGNGQWQQKDPSERLSSLFTRGSIEVVVGDPIDTHGRYVRYHRRADGRHQKQIIADFKSPLPFGERWMRQSAASPITVRACALASVGARYAKKLAVQVQNGINSANLWGGFLIHSGE